MVTSAGSCRTGEIEGVGTVELVCWQIGEDVVLLRLNSGVRGEHLTSQLS